MIHWCRCSSSGIKCPYHSNSTFVKWYISDIASSTPSLEIYLYPLPLLSDICHWNGTLHLNRGVTKNGLHTLNIGQQCLIADDCSLLHERIIFIFENFSTQQRCVCVVYFIYECIEGHHTEGAHSFRIFRNSYQLHTYFSSISCHSVNYVIVGWIKLSKSSYSNGFYNEVK